MIALKLTQFGDPILREKAKPVGKADINSSKLQSLIANMRYTLKAVQLGVGLAAPQVGESAALSVIVIQPTKHRPDVEPYELVLINPEITQCIGRKKQLWEGCISSGKGKAGVFAKVPRYKKIKVRFVDETGTTHHKMFEGLKAHIIQHEVDHLNGILFVDRVKDTKTYMTYDEYTKHIKSTKKA